MAIAAHPTQKSPLQRAVILAVGAVMGLAGCVGYVAFVSTLDRAAPVPVTSGSTPDAVWTTTTPTGTTTTTSPPPNSIPR